MKERISISIGLLLMIVIYGKGVISLNEEILIIIISCIFVLVGINWLSGVTRKGLEERVGKTEEVLNQIFGTRINLLATLQIKKGRKLIIEKRAKNKLYKKIKKTLVKVGVSGRRNIIKEINKVVEESCKGSKGLEKKYVSGVDENIVNNGFTDTNKEVNILEYIINVRKIKNKNNKKGIKK